MIPWGCDGSCPTSSGTCRETLFSPSPAKSASSQKRAFPYCLHSHELLSPCWLTTAPGASWAFGDRKPNLLQLSVQISGTRAASPTAEVLTAAGETFAAPAAKPASKGLSTGTEQGICTPKPPSKSPSCMEDRRCQMLSSRATAGLDVDTSTTEDGLACAFSSPNKRYFYSL